MVGEKPCAESSTAARIAIASPTQPRVGLLKPVLALLAIFTSLSAFNAYLWPLVVLNDESLYTLPLVLAQISTSLGVTNYQVVMAGSLLASIPNIVILLVFQRYIVSGIALTGIKG